jgi:hypothetical protein
VLEETSDPDEAYSRFGPEKRTAYREGWRPIARHAALWRKFTELKELRDELVHLKERGYSPDPAAPSAYSRVMRGDATNAPDDARELIYAMEGKWPEGAESLMGWGNAGAT